MRFQNSDKTTGQSIIGTSSTVRTTVLPGMRSRSASARTNPSTSSMETEQSTNSAVVVSALAYRAWLKSTV